MFVLGWGMKTFSSEDLLCSTVEENMKGIGVAKGVREGSVGNPELQLMPKEKWYGLNFRVAPQPCHTWEHGCLPYAKHLRSQLTAAINTHGALSRGEHYHTTELQIPNLGSEAPWLSALWERGGSLKQDWLGALGKRCVGHPALQLGVHVRTWWAARVGPFFSTHSLGMTHNEPPPDLLSFHCTAQSPWAH